MHAHVPSEMGSFNVCLLLQEHLEQLLRDNDQLKVEVQELLNSSALATPLRDQGKICPLTTQLYMYCLYFTPDKDINT